MRTREDSSAPTDSEEDPKFACGSTGLGIAPNSLYFAEKAGLEQLTLHAVGDPVLELLEKRLDLALVEGNIFVAVFGVPVGHQLGAAVDGDALFVAGDLV